jgi:hypothetical protein
MTRRGIAVVVVVHRIVRSACKSDLRGLLLGSRRVSAPGVYGENQADHGFSPSPGHDDEAHAPRVAPKAHVFALEAVRPGPVQLRIEKRRSWGESKVSDEFVVDLAIEPA